MDENENCAAELRFIVARRQVNMPKAWLKVKDDTRSVDENEDEDEDRYSR